MMATYGQIGPNSVRQKPACGEIVIPSFVFLFQYSGKVQARTFDKKANEEIYRKLGLPLSEEAAKTDKWERGHLVYDVVFEVSKKKNRLEKAEDYLAIIRWGKEIGMEYNFRIPFEACLIWAADSVAGELLEIERSVTFGQWQKLDMYLEEKGPDKKKLRKQAAEGFYKMLGFDVIAELRQRIDKMTDDLFYNKNPPIPRWLWHSISGTLSGTYPTYKPMDEAA